MGSSRCHKILKKAINDIVDTPIPVDPDLDDETIAIINSIESVVLHDAIRHEENEFYKKIVKSHPNMSIFLKGWLNRANW